MARFSEDITTFLEAPERGDTIVLADIVSLAGERGFGFLLMLLSLPSALPLPAPGYSIPFGIVILILALQLIRGRSNPQLPFGWQNRPIKTEFSRQILRRGRWFLRRLELLAKPRWQRLCQKRLGRQVLGVAIALMAISMLIPVPGTNTFPAFSIFVIALGLVEDDGIIASVGLCLSVLAGITSVVILTVGVNILSYLVNQLRSVL